MKRWTCPGGMTVLLVLVVVALGGAPGLGAPGTSAAARLSAILFPTTAGWTLLDHVPALTASQLAGIREHLRTAYASSNLERCPDTSGCSFIDTILERRDLASFHVLDLDGDGVADVVYSGDSACAEGDATVIWFGSKDGSGAFERVVRWNVRLLRVSPGREAKVSSVATGCCADPIDEYYVGTIENERRHGIVRTTKDTSLPSALIESPVAFTTRGEIVLRSGRERKDRYEPNASGLMDAAVFGNVLCRYLKGASGSIRAEERDASGRIWVFVVMDPESHLLRHDAPFTVDAGWVEKAALR